MSMLDVPVFSGTYQPVAVPTLDVLKQIPAQGVVLLLGRLSANDGYGGIYYWDATSEQTADDSVAIVPDGASGAGRWLKFQTAANFASPIAITTTADITVWSGPCVYYGFNVTSITTAQDLVVYDNTATGGTAIHTVASGSIVAGASLSPPVPAMNDGGGVVCQYGVFLDWASAPTAPVITFYVRPLA